MQSFRDNLPFKESWVVSKIPEGQVSKKSIYYWATIILSCAVGLMLVAIASENITATKIYTLSGPAILGTLSLIITLHARNMSISDRIRNLGADATKAMFDGLPNQRVSFRLDSVFRQVTDLHTRYRLNLYSLVAVASNLLIMPLIPLSVPRGQPEFTQVPLQTILLIGFSSFLFTFAAVSTIYDLFLSFVTLEADMLCTYDAIARKRAQVQDIDPDDLAAVVHFNKQYHEIWYVLRVEIELEKDATKKKKLAELFFNRYVGLLHEEYHFFRNDLLPNSLFRQWLHCLRENALVRSLGKRDGVDRLFGGESLLQWWNAKKQEFRDVEFCGFLDKTFEISRHEGLDRLNDAFTLDEIVALVPSRKANDGPSDSCEYDGRKKLHEIADGIKKPLADNNDWSV